MIKDHLIAMSVNSAFKVIHQWDYYDKNKDYLFNEDLMKYCSDCGVTSLQSYIYWADVESEKGVYDFSFYDKLIDKMKKYNLKWTPFIILGPYYSLPEWFRKSEECTFARCCEHHQDSDIASIWNPHLLKYVDTFLKEISTHFNHKDIESVLLGISGNWGESLYPVAGGFIQGEESGHCHPGLWCADPYAYQDFRGYLEKKYRDISTLNQAWGENFASFSAIDFPDSTLLVKNTIKNIILTKISSLIGFLGLNNQAKEILFDKQLRTLSPSTIAKSSDHADWYIASMTHYADRWMKLTRQYFPESEINLVSGGDGNPYFGADFTQQMKKAAQYNAGIRITNQDDSYSNSFILTRWVASVAKNYNSYFTTEEALYNTPEGISMRLYDAETSYCNGVYYKTIFDHYVEGGGCQAEPIGPGPGGENLKENLKYIQQDKPIVKVALLLATTTNRLYKHYIHLLFEQAKMIRPYIDFDLVCEEMIHDNILANYEYLMITIPSILQDSCAEKIIDWQQSGGNIIKEKGSACYNEQKKKLDIPVDFNLHFDKLAELAKYIYPDLRVNYNGNGLYRSIFENKILFYNDSSQDLDFEIMIHNKREQLKIKKNNILQYNF